MNVVYVCACSHFGSTAKGWTFEKKIPLRLSYHYGTALSPSAPATCVATLAAGDVDALVAEDEERVIEDER